MEALDQIDDMSPYFLAKKDGLKLLINIHNYILEVIELPENTNDKKFMYGKNRFSVLNKIS